MICHADLRSRFDALAALHQAARAPKAWIGDALSQLAMPIAVHEDEYILNVRRRVFVRVIVARVISWA
ncbi:hypothetical protein [Bradyrhizobium sp. CCBAU 11361]|uniref:hypothetical protein n=1 Tax=Bradyrhizobium sp. CCBAU 11361 TaxID=1630812 RepID=UPI002303F605|nr:hypothetical protein [Bradyrhizobium sp. CCBAU 11361]